ncbi:MAG: hypothetical protein ACOX2N_07610 [Peptococcia bacterium]
MKQGGIATESTCVSIRKFSEETISPEDLVRLGTMSQEMDAFFRDVIPVPIVLLLEQLIQEKQLP